MRPGCETVRWPAVPAVDDVRAGLGLTLESVLTHFDDFDRVLELIANVDNAGPELIESLRLSLTELLRLLVADDNPLRYLDRV